MGQVTKLTIVDTVPMYPYFHLAGSSTYSPFWRKVHMAVSVNAVPRIRNTAMREVGT